MSERTIKICDTHCHLQQKRLFGEIDTIIKNAENAGIRRIIVPGWDMESSRKAIDISSRFARVFATCGFHPHDAKCYNKEAENLLRKIIGEDVVVGLGEIGLDYYRDLSPRKVQKEVLKEQLAIAENFNVPVIIHTRDSIEDTLEIISKFNVRGIFHAFNYEFDIARKIIDMGFYLGIGGTVTFNNSKISRAIANIPLDKIVLETDAPYLSPVPYRGKKNKPEYTKHILKKVAQLKSLEEFTVSKKTWENSADIFNLNP